MAIYLTDLQQKYEEEKSSIKSILDNADKELAKIGVLTRRIQNDGFGRGVTIDINFINQNWIFEGVNHPNADSLTPMMIAQWGNIGMSKYSKLMCNFQDKTFQNICKKAKIDARVFTPKQRKEIDAIVNKNWAKVANTYIKKMETEIKSACGGKLPNYLDFYLSIRSDQKPPKAGTTVPSQSVGNYDIWKIVGKTASLSVGKVTYEGKATGTLKDAGEDVITSIEKNISKNIYIFNFASGLVFYMSEENYKIPYLKKSYTIQFRDTKNTNKQTKQ